MAGRMRFYPCARYGCPETATPGKAYCATHQPEPWAGRNGTTRTRAVGVRPRTWRRLHRACLVRDNHTCRICGSPGDQADHLVPVAWRTPPVGFQAHLGTLMTLCRACHTRKTLREAAIGRQGPPSNEDIARHIRWWLGQARTVQVVVPDASV